MTEPKLHAFALKMAAEVLRTQHPEAELGQLNIALYNQETDQQAYNIHYDQIEEDFCLCKVLKSEPSTQFTGELPDLFFSSEIEVIAAYKTSEEAAEVLIDLALKENLTPQINYMLIDEL